MTKHRVATREQWLAERLDLLAAEKEHTRRSDALARQRQELPWVKVEQEYSFETPEGQATLADLFGPNSQLLVYHFMFGPDFKAGCPSCSMVAEGFDGMSVHLKHHDVTFTAVSRAPLAKLEAYKKRMEWNFPGYRVVAAHLTQILTWHLLQSSNPLGPSHTTTPQNPSLSGGLTKPAVVSR